MVQQARTNVWHSDILTQTKYIWGEKGIKKAFCKTGHKKSYLIASTIMCI